jgi:hypothetical protein
MTQSKAIVPELRRPEERGVIKSTWWDSHTAASYLGVTRRTLDRKMANGSLPAECSEVVDGVRYYDPEALAPLRTDGAPDVAPPPGDPAHALWRSVSDILRAGTAAIGENQKHHERFLSLIIEPTQRTIALQAGEITRLQAENDRLRDRLFAGMQAIEEAQSQAAERDLRLVAATNRQQMLTQTFRMMKELAPRMLEQFVGIRDVKKEIGKLSAVELATLVQLVPKGPARDLLQSIHAEEAERFERLKKTLRGNGDNDAGDASERGPTNGAAEPVAAE